MSEEREKSEAWFVRLLLSPDFLQLSPDFLHVKRERAEKWGENTTQIFG
jgi:hypothetical protein